MTSSLARGVARGRSEYAISAASATRSVAHFCKLRDYHHHANEIRKVIATIDFDPGERPSAANIPRVRELLSDQRRISLPPLTLDASSEDILAAIGRISGMVESLLCRHSLEASCLPSHWAFEALPGWLDQLCDRHKTELRRLHHEAPKLFGRLRAAWRSFESERAQVIVSLTHGAAFAALAQLKTDGFLDYSCYALLHLRRFDSEIPDKPGPADLGRLIQVEKSAFA